MVDQSLYSPISPHFFQPFLPGFHTHLFFPSIPVAFFSKHVVGRNQDHIKTAKLRTDASDKTWTVEMDGSKFTDGWEDFAVAHDLRVGDITVFRHEGEMGFHVTALGPSCCEIQYALASSHNINDDSHGQTNNVVTGNSSREKRKRVKDNPKPVPQASLHSSCYVGDKKNKRASSSCSQDRFVTLTLTQKAFKYCQLFLPMGFAKGNGIYKPGKIALLGPDGVKKVVALSQNKRTGQMQIGKGWRAFRDAHGVKIGQPFVLELIWEDEASPVLRFCTKP